MFSWLIRLWKRHINRLWSSLSAPLDAIRSAYRRPDILNVGTDGTIRVATPRGPAPLRPRMVAHTSFSSERTQRLARRAAAFLFDYYGFESVPAQFWPLLERTFDPGQAMDIFLRAVGCNPERVRQRDSVELKKAADVIDLLVRSGDILHRLPPKVREIVGLQLESGDYARIRELAEVAAHLQAALDFAEAWTGKAVVASFAELLRTIQRMLNDPMKVAAAEAATAVGLVAQFAEAQSRFDRLSDQFTALTDALIEAWPHTWRGGPQEGSLRRLVGDFEHVGTIMKGRANLTFEQLKEGNDFLASYLNALEDLLDTARGKHTGGSRRPPGDPGRAPPSDELELALRYFGFSKGSPPRSKAELGSARKKKLYEVHPDKNPGATDDEIVRLNEECYLCEKRYRMLLARFSWHRPA